MPPPAQAPKPAYRTAGALAEDLAARRVSAVELLDDAIARIERCDGALNAVAVRDFARARRAAAAADAALARDERRPLLGVPMTVKESYNVAGLPTTWGMPQFATFRADEDAVAVARLKAAGAIVLGKTNVPFALGDWQSYNDIYGTTNNPWDLARTPGGSSGGAAVAVAALAGALYTPAPAAAEETSGAVIRKWDGIARTQPTGNPLRLSRVLAIMHTAQHDAVNG
ncbi:MAG: amidase family protein, partial [Candidatus Velthaea sp.]